MIAPDTLVDRVCSEPGLQGRNSSPSHYDEVAHEHAGGLTIIHYDCIDLEAFEFAVDADERQALGDEVAIA